MKSLLNFISFTRNETKVILFITAVIIAGLCIKYYKQVLAPGANVKYDFSKSDSEFVKLSAGAINKNSKTEQSESTGFDSASISIDINTASKEELINLPGVGESTALKIISYREQKNGFKKTEELMNVSGIGKKKFDKIKPYIKIN